MNDLQHILLRGELWVFFCVSENFDICNNTRWLLRIMKPQKLKDEKFFSQDFTVSTD